MLTLKLKRICPVGFNNQEDTICALSTANGVGAISLVRMSGAKAIEIAQALFSTTIKDGVSHKAYFGKIMKGDDILDEVLLTVFRNPKSFTGEDTVEIACHGSKYVQNSLLKLLVEKGARMADPGEFSLRAFMNGKMDLSQTEAVADLISAGSEASHRLAMHQMRGGFANEISDLRQGLLDFASLIELELDFSQEDVEFADRTQLTNLVQQVKEKVNQLCQSFQYGNVIKNGVPVAIVGAPNAGKSTLLNALLREDKAIVSDIAGTTRDVIEDTIVLDGIEFRFIDTAGIRETQDTVESLGIERAFDQIRKARIVLLLFDLETTKAASILDEIDHFKKESISDHQDLIVLLNKSDKLEQVPAELNEQGLLLSAKEGKNVDLLVQQLLEIIQSDSVGSDLVVTNIRHYEILSKCEEALIRVEQGLEMGIPSDLLAQDIRETLSLLGEITGEISTDDLLGNIFSNFCIGK